MPPAPQQGRRRRGGGTSARHSARPPDPHAVPPRPTPPHRPHLQILPRRLCSIRTSSPPSWAAIAPAPSPAHCVPGEERGGRSGPDARPPPAPLRPPFRRPRGAPQSSARRRCACALCPFPGSPQRGDAVPPRPAPHCPRSDWPGAVCAARDGRSLDGAAPTARYSPAHLCPLCYFHRRQELWT